MLNVFAELEPGALDYPVAREKFELARRASGLWERHLAMLNGHRASVAPLRIDHGTTLLHRERPGSFATKRFDAILQYLEGEGEGFREIDPREVRGLQVEGERVPTRAVVIDDEGRVDARALLEAYDEIFAKHPRIRVIDDEVSSIDARRPTRVGLGSGAMIFSERVVIAAGARTQELVEGLGLHERIPRVIAAAGVAVVLRVAPTVPSTVLRWIDDDELDLYAVPYGDRLYVGATTHVQVRGESEPPVDASRQLVDAVRRKLNPAVSDADKREVLFGWRPVTLDTHPLIGRTSIEGVWLASGTRRDGFHLSPLIAEELARCLMTGAQPFEGLFRPERPLLLEVPRGVALERAVARAGGPVGAARTRVQELYRRAGFESAPFGIPPELLDVYAQGYARPYVR